MTKPFFIYPDWPAPSRVRAVCTTRHGGYSKAPYDSFNLADHVDDDPAAVQANRKLLRELLELPNEPVWLEQVHGTNAVAIEDVQQHLIHPSPAPTSLVLPSPTRGEGKRYTTVLADSCYATTPHQICVTMMADCLAILLCDEKAQCVAAVHAGWRGLSAGVVENTIRALSVPSHTLMAWLSPAISASVYEVGEEVREAFLMHDEQAANAFTAKPNGKWLADMYLLARQRLQSLDIRHIYGGNHCTYNHPDQFFSFRRDKTTGRMASLIWLTK